MRYLFLIVIVTTCCAGCHYSIKGNNGEVYKSPSQYNDYIVNRQTTIMQDVMDFVKASQISLDSSEKMLDGFITTIDSIVIDIKGMPAYKGDSALRDAAIGTFGFYKKIFGNEYKQLIQIRRDGGAETEDGVAKMKAIVSTITEEEQQFDDRFHKAQRDFADKNKMKLTENTMQKKIEDMK